MDTLGHYRAAIGLFVQRPPRSSRKSNMEEPFGRRKRLSGSEIVWGFGALFCCILACGMVLQMNRISFGTFSSTAKQIASPHESNRRLDKLGFEHENGQLPTTLLNLVTYGPVTGFASSSDDPEQTTIFRQILVNELATCASCTSEADETGVSLAWDSPFRHGGEVWCVLVLWGSYLSFVRLRLLLAADVERNPGPVDVNPKLHSGASEENTAPPSSTLSGDSQAVSSSAEFSASSVGVTSSHSQPRSNGESPHGAVAQKADETEEGDDVMSLASPVTTSTQKDGEHGGTDCLPYLSQSTVNDSQLQLRRQRQQPPHVSSELQQ